MAIVDLTQLTDQQRWGLQFAVMQINDPEITEQKHADDIIIGQAETYLRDLLEYKTNIALQLFNSLSPEDQAALVAQLQIPDVL